MKTQYIALAALAVALTAGLGRTASAQGPLQAVTEHSHRHSGFHAGIHSGSWTLKREQILEEESKDPHRSCKAPYCNRCSKHLADYGHEYQYIDGPSQRQAWYRGTAGSVAHVTQRCYDEHGLPYARRGRPGAVMSWEYRCHLNHAISEQIRARNAVAAEEAAEERVGLLNELRDYAILRLSESEDAWKWIEQSGGCVADAKYRGALSPCMRALGAKQKGKEPVFQSPKVSLDENDLPKRLVSSCDYCRAKAQYMKDHAYLLAVEKELGLATFDWQRKTTVADEAVRIALLSKEDADKATRFKRIQHKPPKYKEVLAAREAAKALAGKENGESTE